MKSNKIVKKITAAKRAKYEPKQAVKGSFMDIINASVKDASKKSAKKKA